MTVEELIKDLEKYPKDLEVFIGSEDIFGKAKIVAQEQDLHGNKVLVIEL